MAYPIKPIKGRISHKMVTGGVGGWSERPKMGGVGHVDLNGWVTVGISYPSLSPASFPAAAYPSGSKLVRQAGN